MKTLSRGFRQDPLPWWDIEIDEAIEERNRLEKIRDSLTSEVRQQKYRAHAVIVQQVIQAKRRVTWQKFATDQV